MGVERAIAQRPGHRGSPDVPASLSSRRKSLFTFVFGALLLLSGALMAEPFAYVPNEGSGTISIVDTATDAVTDVIRTGGKPRGIAFNPRTQLLYVSDSPSSTLKIIDPDERKVVAQVPLGKSPEGVYISQMARSLRLRSKKATASLSWTPRQPGRSRTFR